MSAENLARRAWVDITFQGVSITNSIRPYFLSLTYTDNEDGKTHSGYCRYHQDKTTAKENHEFQKGRCIQCGAVDYNSVAAAIEKNKTVYVAIGEENAKLSMEEITLTAGNADITKEYNITYAWFDKNGANVGNGSSYTLPAAVTEEEAAGTLQNAAHYVELGREQLLRP